MKCGAYFPACATSLFLLSNIKLSTYDFPFNVLKAGEQQIVFQVDMLEQRIHKRFQFLHQQTVAGTAVLRYGEVIRQLNNMQVTVSFSLVLHLHHPDRIRYRTAMHRGHTLSLFLCCVQFI